MVDIFIQRYTVRFEFLFVFYLSTTFCLSSGASKPLEATEMNRRELVDCCCLYSICKAKEMPLCLPILYLGLFNFLSYHSFLHPSLCAYSMESGKKASNATYPLALLNLYRAVNCV